MDEGNQGYSGIEKRNADKLREYIDSHDPNGDYWDIGNWIQQVVILAKKSKITFKGLKAILCRIFEKNKNYILQINSLLEKYWSTESAYTALVWASKTVKPSARDGFFLLFFDLFVFIPIFIFMTHQTTIIMTIKIISPLG